MNRTGCTQLEEPFETIRQQLIGYFTGKGVRSIQLSIPLANISEDQGYGAGTIRVDNITSIAPNADGITISEATGGSNAGGSKYHVVELVLSKSDQNPNWNETFRIYKRDITAGAPLRLLGDAKCGILAWRSYGTEEENVIPSSNATFPAEELWVAFVNYTGTAAVLHATISW